MEFSDASNAWTFSKAIQSAMVEIAERSGDLSIFMGEDMEVAGAFGLNLALKAKGHGISYSICLFQNPSSSNMPQVQQWEDYGQ